MVKRLLNKIKAAFWNAIHTDQVRPFVWVYYISLWVWGVYGTFFAAPATYVQPVMGAAIYDLWIWLCMAGTSMVMGGLYLEDTARRDNICQVAVRLQTGGHACMFFVLLAYEVSAAYATAWGQGTFSIFVIAPYVVGCLLLTAQGVVKIVDGGP